jgi:hypothetical protein
MASSLRRFPRRRPAVCSSAPVAAANRSLILPGYWPPPLSPLFIGEKSIRREQTSCAEPQLPSSDLGTHAFTSGTPLTGSFFSRAPAIRHRRSVALPLTIQKSRKGGRSFAPTFGEFFCHPPEDPLLFFFSGADEKMANFTSSFLSPREGCAIPTRSNELTFFNAQTAPRAQGSAFELVWSRRRAGTPL